MAKGGGGKGMIAMKVTEKTGPVCGAIVVSEEDELMAMTSTGQSVRTLAKDIRVIGRATQGVQIMPFKKGETIQDIAQWWRTRSQRETASLQISVR